tara:strand:+ start:65 stop:1420 length:1356 start_codon:yes stop_codon:yes gene_type:complete
MQVPTINIEMIIREELNLFREQKPDNLMPGQSDYGLSGDYTADQLAVNARKQMDGIHDLADFVVNHPHEIIQAAQQIAIFIPGGYGLAAYGLLGLLDAAVYVFDDKDYYKGGIAVVETLAMLGAMKFVDKFAPAVLKLGKQGWNKILRYFKNVKNSKNVQKKALEQLTKQEKLAVDYIIKNPKSISTIFSKATLAAANDRVKKYFSKPFSELVSKVTSSKAAAAIFYIQYALKTGMITVQRVITLLGRGALTLGMFFGTDALIGKNLTVAWSKIYHYLGLAEKDFNATMESKEMGLIMIQALQENNISPDIQNMSIDELTAELARLDAKTKQIPEFSKNMLATIPIAKQIDVDLVTANAGNIQQFLIDKGLYKQKVDWSFGDSTAEAFSKYFFNGMTAKYNGQPIQGKGAFKLLFNKFKNAGYPIGDKIGAGPKFIKTIANIINRKEIQKS